MRTVLAGHILSMLDIAAALRGRLGEAAKKVPTPEPPNWLVRLAAVFDRTAAAAAV